MPQSLADELVRNVDLAALELRAIDEALAAARPGPGVWSIKEILGHLIDSAANNHQRFVRARQSNELSFPGYAQDAWVQMQDYQDRSWSGLVDFWVLFNHHLAHVIRGTPDSAGAVPCRIGTDKTVTLGFLMEDYVVHLRHHLEQIQDRRNQPGSAAGLERR